MKYVVLTTLLITQLSAAAQVQEVYRRKYLLGLEFKGRTKTKTLTADRVISVSSLTTPVTGTPAIGTDIYTLTAKINVISGTISRPDDKDIIISSGAKIKEKSRTPLLIATPTNYTVLKANETTPNKDARLAYYYDILNKRYPVGSVVTNSVERKLPEGKVMAEEKISVTEAFRNTLTIDVVSPATKKPSTWGYVKFDEDKVWVNPHLVDGASTLHYYQLSNRRTITMWASDFSVSALTMPLKYRFKGKRDNGKSFTEDFASAVNVNVFLGPSVGKTSFHYREKVGNVSNTWKLTGGLLLGGSTVTLTKSNTTAADMPIMDTSEITKGLLSVGYGLAYSYNKATFGAFLGRDFSVGKDASRWDYNRKPWLGIAIGYSVFSI